MALSDKRSKTQDDPLISLGKENRWAFFKVGELQSITRLPPKEMSRLRKLAATSPKDDPWRGDYVQPDKFLEWYHGRRRQLEIEHPEI